MFWTKAKKKRRQSRRSLWMGLERLEDRSLLTAVAETGIDDLRISFVGPDNASDLADVREHATAYNPVAGEYLIVWSADDTDEPGIADQEYEVFGQLVGEEGDIRRDFRISTAGGTGDSRFAARQPDVVYNSTTNQYLVVWRADDTDAPGIVDNEFEVFGQLLDADGNKVGIEEFRISDVGGFGDAAYDAHEPKVSWNPQANSYLVVWTANDADAGLHQFDREVFGQLLDAGGNEIGTNDFRISDAGGVGGAPFVAAHRAEVVANTQTGEYLVTWQSDDTDSGDNPDGQYEIFGQRLDSAGNEVGDNDFQISRTTGHPFDVLQSSIAYNDRDNEYFVTWISDHADAGLLTDEYEVFGQILTAAGARRLSDDLLLSDVGGIGNPAGDAFGPSVAWNNQSQEYLVAWYGGDPELPGGVNGESRIFGQRVDAAGREIGVNDFLISSDSGGSAGNGARTPSVTWNSRRNEYAVTWISDAQSHGLQEVYAQRFQVQETVPLDLRNHFNVDVIVDGSDAIQDAVDVAGRVLVTNAFAQAASPDGRGLPDDGFLPAYSNHPAVQLAYPSQGDGFNAVRLDAGESIELSGNQARLYKLYVYGFSVGDPGSVTLEIQYADGTVSSNSELLYGWSADLGRAAIDDMDWALHNGTGFEDINDLAIHHASDSLDIDREVERITIRSNFGPIFLLGAGRPGYVPETIVVTTANDEADGNLADDDVSLREAIHRANRSPHTADTIVFDPVLQNATLGINHGSLRISGSTSLVGPGADRLTIDGGRSSQIFSIRKATTGVEVFLSGTTLANAWNNNPDLAGGAVYTDASLSLDGVAIRSSQAEFGAGVYVAVSGNLDVINSEFSHNTARFGGGAIWTAANSTVINSTLSHNQTNREGGAIHVYDGLTLVHNSTLVANRANANGQSPAADAEAGLGGGLYARSGAQAALYNSILAGNLNGPALGASDDVAGSINFGSASNLIGVDRGAGALLADRNDNQVGVLTNPLNPRLSGLGRHGGTTQTHALSPDSPAIDAGNNTFAVDQVNSSLTTDQRGLERIADGDGDETATVDIGAFEAAGQDVDLRGWWTRVASGSKNAVWGASIVLDRVQIENQGTDASGDFAVQWYLSQDTDLSTDDVLLDLTGGGNSLPQNSIDGGQRGPLQSVELDLPNALPAGFAGTEFYVLASIDSFDDVAETDENNNSGVARFWDYDRINIADNEIDLRGWWTSVDSGSAIARWSDTITLDKVQVQNVGGAASGAFHLQWYISQDTTLSSDDILLNLAGGGSAMPQASIDGGQRGPLQTVDLQLPPALPASLSGVQFHVLMAVDALNEVAETDENNNSGTLRNWDYDKIRISDGNDVDLRGWWTRVAPGEDSVGWGTTLTLDRVQVQNQGIDASDPFHLQWYLSEDTTLSSDDVLLQLSSGASALAHDGLAGLSLGELQSVEFDLPASPPAGLAGDRFYVLTSVDAQHEVAESDESNNSGQARVWDYDDVTIRDDTDLRGWWTRVDAGSKDAAWGDTITLDRVQVQNAGTRASGSFELQWYLSPDARVSADDVRLDLSSGAAGLPQAGIAANGLSPLQSVELVLPSVSPFGFVGPHFFIVTHVDAFDEVAEPNEHNNLGGNPLWGHDLISITASLAPGTGEDSAAASQAQRLGAQFLAPTNPTPVLEAGSAALSAPQSANCLPSCSAGQDKGSQLSLSSGDAQAEPVAPLASALTSGADLTSAQATSIELASTDLAANRDAVDEFFANYQP